jgi:hypothetical protein
MLLKASASSFVTLAAYSSAVLSLVFPLATPASEISIVGPIEAVDCKAGVIQVLGVRLSAQDAKAAKLVCSLGVASRVRSAIVRGEVVAANNVHLKSLQLASKDYYVAGASQVYLKGEVSDVRLQTGTISVGGASVDASFQLPALGSMIEVAGTQPLLGGVITPTQLIVITGPQASDNASSVGSGVATNSSVGSGVATNSSVGSGVVTNSSVGSGVALDSSVGSGVALNSSVGSGVSLNSSVGSGKAINSSVGSGKSLSSSVGSGIALQSSVGSGVRM